MKLENPWVQAACADRCVAPNRLPTHLQEQYGQLGEDLILEGVLRSHFARAGLSRESARYMEIGANHPIQTSNTYLFYRKWGGQGLLVEANPALVDALAAVRPRDRVLNRAVVAPGSPRRVQITVAKNAELSSVDPGHVASFGSIGVVEGQVEVDTVTLDELLAAEPADLHLLSIDIEGLDYEVLARSKLPRRPLFIVAEPSRHYHADADEAFARMMGAHDYVEIARTEYNLIYRDRRTLAVVGGASDSVARTSPREVIGSFDVFDTLIARRCIHPNQVFVEMERRSGIPGLAAQRHAAERRVQQGPLAAQHSLADIHRELAAAFGLDDAQSEVLARLEVEIEREQVIPIVDNLARVDAQSILVSDMYLPETDIRALLREGGLHLDLPLLRSNDGKASGRLWRELAARGVQCRHLGDNPHSDVAQARAAGMCAELSTLHAPTSFEQELYVAGLPETAMSLRAARLATPAAGLPATLQTLQVELNLPTLLVATVVALTYARAADMRLIAFASRDGRGLQALADRLLATGRFGAMRTRYWHTSRLARSSGDPEYEDYCRQLFADCGLLVDLCGTGTSVARLAGRLGLDQIPPLFVAEYVHAPEHVREMSALYHLEEPPQKPLHVFDTQRYVCNVTLEMLNYSPEGMVRTVRRVPGGFVPQRDPVDLPGVALDLAGCQQRYLTGLIAAIGAQAERHPALITEWEQSLARLAELLHERASRFAGHEARLNSLFRAFHDANEVALKAELAHRNGESAAPVKTNRT